MADREVWIVEWHDGSGKGTLAGYAFFSEAAGWRHVEQTRAEDDIRAKHGRARAWEGATWTVTRYIPAESAKAEAQPAGTGWVRVEERLPQEGVVVHVATLDDDYVPSVRHAGDGRFYTNGGYAGRACHQPPYVTHWRPLPPPPEPRE